MEISVITLQSILMDQSLPSAGYAFYIPELHMSFTNNLPPSSSSFTAECHAILEALTFISYLAPTNYLIASDSISCLLPLKSNSFNSHLSPLCFAFNKLPSYFTNQITSSSFCGSLATEIYGIYGNEIADSLAKSTSNLICPLLSNFLIPITLHLYVTT